MRAGDVDHEARGLTIMFRRRDTSHFWTITRGISELPPGPVGPMVLLADGETGIACELRELKEAYAHATRCGPVSQSQSSALGCASALLPGLRRHREREGEPDTLRVCSTR